MPATTFQGMAHGTEMGESVNSSLITAAETNQLKTGPGKCARILNGNGFTNVDIYDATAGTSNPIFNWVTADGKNVVVLTPFQNGLRVVTTGTGSVRINWS